MVEPDGRDDKLHYQNLPDTFNLELARQMHERGVKIIVVTRSEKGAIILNDAEVTEVPGIGINVVDTTGAGDAFNAGLAVALAEGKPLVEAVQFATCTGALACTVLGVIPAMARREVAERMYRQHYVS